MRVPANSLFHVKQHHRLEHNVSRETIERLDTYCDLLLRWNARINLIGKADAGNVWNRHIADSLQLRAFIPVGTIRAIDLGSGAGFPGMVLAISTDIQFDLVEADQRKAAFLREAGRLTGAPVLVHAARIERADIPAAMVVTARALAPLTRLLDLAHRFMLPGGVAIFPKGANLDRELTEARGRWNMRVETFPSQTAGGGTIIKLSEVARG